MNELKREIKQLIVSCLNLSDVEPDQIVDDAPLFREGLGLDSIDALELAVAIERTYKVTIPDEAVGKKVFAATTRAKRSGCSATIRSPMSPPQSWQTSVMRRRSSASTSARIQSTWRW